MRLLTSLCFLLFSVALSAQCLIDVSFVSSSCGEDGDSYFVEFSVEGTGDSLWELRRYNLVGEYNTGEVYRIGPLDITTERNLIFRDLTVSNCAFNFQIPFPECPENPCYGFELTDVASFNTGFCFEDIVQLTIIGGNFPVDVSIFAPGDVLIYRDSFFQSPIFITEPLFPGNFVLRATDDAGCLIDTTFFTDFLGCSYLEGRSWLDENENGLQDPEETTPVAATVTLIGENGDFRQSRTDGEGLFVFDEISAGFYQLQIQADSDEFTFEPTIMVAGNDVLNSDINGNLTTNSSVFLPPGDQVTDIDAGWVRRVNCDSLFVFAQPIGDFSECGDTLATELTVFSSTYPVEVQILTINGNVLVEEFLIQGEETFTPDLGPGAYTVEATNPEGCMVSTVFEVVVNQNLTVNILTEGTLCSGEAVVLEAVVEGADPNEIFYNWSTGETTQTITVTGIGTVYDITVTNADNCVGLARTVVSQDTLNFIDLGPNVILDCQTTSATLSVPDPLPRYTYTWFGPLNQILTGPTVEVVVPGRYNVEGQGPDACNIFGSVIVLNQSIPSGLTIEPFDQDTVFCDGQGCFGIMGLNNIDYEHITIDWDGPPEFDESVFPGVNTAGWCSPYPGLYTAILSAPGCDTVRLTYELGNPSCQLISGTLWLDEASNCALDAEDTVIPSYLLEVTNDATGDVYYTFTNNQGEWSVSLVPGTYTIEPILDPEQPFTQCPDLVTVTLADEPVEGVNVFLPVLVSCPLLSTGVTIPFLRRCFDNYAYVEYENTGSATALDAELTVTLDDFLINATPSIPATRRVGQTFTFDLGDVPPFTSVRIYFEFTVGCNAQLGQTHCIEAAITPDEPCVAPQDWDGALVNVTGSNCSGDSLTFTISNVGDNPMTVPLNYIVVEDGIMLTPAPVENGLLEPSEDYIITLPANGSTYMIITNQEPNAPGAPQPTAVVEGCGTNANGNFSTGFANILALDFGNNAQSIACRQNVGAYDPNDKMGYPLGYSGGNIPEGTRLDYEIRFQNTGTDTAFTVVIRDTLSAALDMATFKVEAASHPYTVSVDTHRVISFTFNDIMLPDSSTNLIGSQGAVSFSIDHDVSLLPGDIIDNEAAIYFDFNEPIITNVSRHRIAKDGLPVGVRAVAAQEIAISVYPNPSAGRVNVNLPLAEVNSQDVLVVSDLLGRPLLSSTYGQAAGGWDLSELPTGYYLMLLQDEAGRTRGRTGFVIR
ncbi:SdrD B-like domain-containing protein [Neolewinella agarilytica]|uniref:DUF7619 domain-containing protein n=1 Tax=Neolewinella agarilytica TaxID=478744 RepID=UPI002353E13A|nr:SdrD B-like domain-containing protein [Neolewinella agarilytica]